LDYRTELKLIYAALGYELGRLLEVVRVSNLPVELKIPGGLEASLVSEQKVNPRDVYTNKTYSASTGLDNSNVPVPKSPWGSFYPSIAFTGRGHHHTYDHGSKTTRARRLNDNRARKKPAGHVQIRSLTKGTSRDVGFVKHAQLFK